MLFTYSAGTFSAFSFYSIVHLIFLFFVFLPMAFFQTKSAVFTRLVIVVLWLLYVPLVCPILGFELKLPTTVLVLQLSSNLVRISNFLSVSNFWKKNQNLSLFDDVITIFWKKYLEIFLEMRTSMVLKHFKHKT